MNTESFQCIDIVISSFKTLIVGPGSIPIVSSKLRLQNYLHMTQTFLKKPGVFLKYRNTH